MIHESQQRRETLHSLDNIPTFATEAEEAAFWDSHDLGEEVVARMGPLPADVLPPTRPRTRPAVVSLDEDMLQRVKVLARKRHKGYQTLIREFVAERLAEEEQREARTGS